MLPPHALALLLVLPTAVLAGGIGDGHARQLEYPGGSRDRGVVETLASWRPFFEAATDFSPFTTTTPTANHQTNHLEWQLRAQA